MKKQTLLLLFIAFNYYTFSQVWEKTSDFLGLDAYCTLNSSLIGTSKGVIYFTTYNNEWKRIGLKDRKVYSLYHDWAGAKDTIIAGTDKGIYISPDKGATWQLTNAPLLKYNNVNLMKLYTDNRVLYASSDEGVYYAAKNLSDWKYYALTNYKVNKYVGLVADTVRIFACDKGLIFTGEKYGIRNKTAVMEIKGVIDLIDYSKDWVAGKIFSILVTKNGLYDIERDSLYYGKTNNLEWNQRGSGIENQEINWMHLSSKFKATLGTNNGIFLSNDTGHVFSKRAYIDNKMTSFSFPGEGQAGFNDYYYTTLGGGFYKNETLIGYSNIQTLQLAPDGSMFVGTNGFGIFQSSDNGKTWHERNVGLENLDVRDIEFISNGNIFAATRNGAFLSEDKGASWQPVKPQNFALHCIMEGQPQDGLVVFGSGKSTFYWLTSNFNWNGGVNELKDEINVIRYNPKMNMYLAGGKLGLWKSETQYVSWLKFTNYPNYAVYDIEIDKDGRILVLTASTLYYSDDNGESWQTTTSPGNGNNDLTIDDNGNYFVANNMGVYHSSDRGISWKSNSTGFENLPYAAKIDCIEIDNDNYLWAGSKTSGLYRSKYPINTFSGFKNYYKNKETLDIRSFFHQSDKRLDISFVSPKSDRFKIEVFKIDGMLVHSQNLNLITGENNFSIDLSQLKSGIFLFNVQNSVGLVSQKFVVQ